MTYRARRTRTAGALVALCATGGLLLTGCSGSGDAKHPSAAADSGYRGGLPAPAAPSAAPYAPGAAEDADGAQKRDAKPAPENHLSTFALDVDTASYGYARRSLADGHLPSPETVRPEEFVNSFHQDYPQPDGDGFSVTVDGARTGGDWSLVRVGLATRSVPQKSRPPAALTFVVDVSGSMAEPGRLDLVRDALTAMTRSLREDDAIAVVAFSDEAEVVLPMTRMGGHRDRIRDSIGRLRPTSSTNLAAGVRTGYDTASEGLRKGATNRVVLLSDALANTGETDADAILDRISEERREHGITLFGVGVGSEYGDSLMENLADKGDGHTTYVAGREEARALFTEQLPANIGLRARDAKAQVAFDPDNVREFRLIGYDNRVVDDRDFRNDRVDGGEVGPGHTVTALYAVRTRHGAEGPLAKATVRWLEPDSRAPHETSGTVDAGDLAPALRKADNGLRLTAVAAYFADALRGRDDRYARLPESPSLSDLSGQAEELAGRLTDPAVRDLAKAVRQAVALDKPRPKPERTDEPGPVDDRGGDEPAG